IDELVVMLMNDRERDQRRNDRGQRIQADARDERSLAALRSRIDLHPDLRHEAVADPRNGLDEHRLLRAVVEHDAQAAEPGVEHDAQAVERYVEAVIEVDGRVRPQARPDLVARYQPARFFEQQDEELERLTSQPENLPLARQTHRGSRELEFAELQYRRHGSRIVAETLARDSREDD